MKNILFIIPHPDDEIVGSCCIIKRYISNKKNINYMRNKILNELKPMSWKKIFEKFFIDEWNLILK